MLTQERLKSLLQYDPETGVFTWRARKGTAVAGRPAGCIISPARPYIRIGIDGAIYRAHNLAWLWLHGSWPQHEIDHINRDPADNRAGNLRDVTHRENVLNRSPCSPAKRRPKPNSTGLAGVRRKRKRFDAQIYVKGKGTKYLGVFDTPEQAHAAYLEAKAMLA